MSRRQPTLSDHARRQAARRGIAESIVLDVAADPEQTLVVRAGREVRQSRVLLADGGSRLVRVVVDVVGDDTKVVTVYRTDQVARYCRLG